MPPAVSVFGLGYVGTTTAACLSGDLGVRVIAVDVAKEKVDAANNGESPVTEPGLRSRLQKALSAGRFRATYSAHEAVSESDIALVCVGTPGGLAGQVNTEHLERVSAEIGRALRERRRAKPFLVVVRSTVLPGTTRNLVTPLIRDAAASEPGHVFDVLVHPEFFREATSVEDFFDPVRILVGERDPSLGLGREVLNLYEGIDGQRLVTDLEVAEMIKYADNAFHATKITFANEIGVLCGTLGIDAREVMQIVAADRRLNASAAYLRPGFSFGGSCLPKDLRALAHSAKDSDLEIPMLASVLASNRSQIEAVLERIASKEVRSIGLIGLAFKSGTDDLRESPYVALAEWLIGKGYNLRIFDGNVNGTELTGANREYALAHVPHLSKLLVKRIDDLDDRELIVAGRRIEHGLLERWLGTGKLVIDLTGSLTIESQVDGLYW